MLMLDYIYKTNRFNILLLNIYSTTSNNITLQFVFTFLSGEKEEDYSWLLSAFKEIMLLYRVNNLRVFVTDRELALLNTLDKLFPFSDHLLCRQYININVVAKTKKHFKTKEMFDLFYTAQTTVINSVSEEQYSKKLAELQTFRKYLAIVVKYIVKTQLIQKEKIVRTLLLISLSLFS